MRAIMTIIAAVGLAMYCSLALAAGPEAAPVRKAVENGVTFLKSSQSEDGSWTSSTSAGITGLVVHSLLISGTPVDDPAVVKGLKFLEAQIQPDGGIYFKDSGHKNYETAVAILALQSANTDGRYQRQIDNAVQSLKSMQWDDGEGIDPSDPRFGGAGYGRSQRPDLSNTTFFLDALKTAGVPTSDPAVQNALIFVSRCQNLPGQHNTTEFAGKVDDGGFYYTIANGGSSVAGKTPDGGLRSYGSMTYAGLKSMIYAGLTSDDYRVKAAENWIRKFYSLDENPGLGAAGLYYYYQTFARTMQALGGDEFIDAAGQAHDWRRELAEKLISQQQPNGSWINETSRFMEGDPNLVTAYSLIAMQPCLP